MATNTTSATITTIPTAAAAAETRSSAIAGRPCDAKACQG